MSKYINRYEAKSEIIDIGKRMYDREYVAANDGNISCKIDDDIIITTPTGVSKGFMTTDMLVEMTLDGKVKNRGDYKPSSEVKMHLRVYKENPDVMAVVHAHPKVATSFSIAGIALDQPIMTESILTLGSVYVAKYATPGTEEVPDSIAPYCKDYNAVLLSNHGALTWGSSLMEAYFRMESLEHYACVLLNTSRILKQQNELSCSQISKLIEIREKMGITAGGMPPCKWDPESK